MTRSRRLAALVTLVALAACGGGGGGDPDDDDRTPTTIAIQTGNFQTTRYGTAVPIPPAVIVSDAQGPIPSFPVTFTVATGGGTITGGSATTNAGGVATLGGWTLGPQPGGNTVTATAGSRTVTIVATAVPGPASALAIEAGNNQSATGGSTVATNPAVKVTDGTFPVSGITVTFAVTQGGGSVTPLTAVTNADGLASTAWRLGTAGGTNQMTAAAAGLSTVTFSASAVPLQISAVTVIAGSGVSAYPGNFTPILPVAEVRDQFGAPVANVPVTFAVTGGGGSVAFPAATTGSNGRASPGAWRFGTSGGQTLTASVGGVATPATFTGSITPVPASQFNIQLVYLDPQPTNEQKAKFEQARQRWQNIIVGDIPDFPNGFAANAACGAGSNTPAITGPIDDVVIFAGIRPIDGAGSVLAQAGPCQIRATGRLTIVGIVSFDDADVPLLETLGSGIADVAFHEMGHVFGFGTLWSDFGVLQFPGSANAVFSGAAGRQAYAALLNPANPAPASFDVPVENCVGIPGCGAGTQDGHWREPIFGSEIMTGFYNANVVNPFSALSAASMRDLTYVVNDAAVDAFSLPLVFGNLRAGAGGATRLREQLSPWPIQVVDDAGNVVGEARR
jgi:hypothetical protein